MLDVEVSVITAFPDVVVREDVVRAQCDNGCEPTALDFKRAEGGGTS